MIRRKKFSPRVQVKRFWHVVYIIDFIIYILTKTSFGEFWQFWRNVTKLPIPPKLAKTCQKGFGGFISHGIISLRDLPKLTPVLRRRESFGAGATKIVTLFFGDEGRFFCAD